MKIAIITEGGLEMGMGHVYRSITLAEELQAKGGEIYFLTKSNHIVVNQIGNSGFKVIKLKNNGDIIHSLEEIKPNVAIIDRGEVEELFAKKLKDKLNARLVIFGNLSTANKYADVVINIIGSNFKNRKFLDKNTNTLYYYGPRYYILRKEFYEFKKSGKELNDRIKKILLIFGGSDPLNLTSKVLDELLSWEEELKINVVLGTGFIYFDELNKVIEKYQNKKGNVKLYRDVKNIAELMYKADLAIVSPGISMFEALCVGTPVIAISETSFQKNLFDEFFPTLHEDEIDKLKNIISTCDFLKPNEKYIKNLDIGEGKMEVIETIIGGIKNGKMD